MKYKFLRTGLKSDSGSLKWKIGAWFHQDGTLDMCHTGFHCSRYPDQAFSYVRGEILAIVQTKGKSIIQDDKECWSDMKIVKAYKWQKKDSVALTIYAAELVIDIFEKEYPSDDRPRKAIEAAKSWIKNPTKKNIAAVEAVEAAEAAVTAARAVEAAGAAAWAAEAAVTAARAVEAAEAAEAAIVKKIRIWMTNHIKELEEIT